MIFELFHKLIHKIYRLNIKILIKFNNNKYSKAFILQKLIELNNKTLNDLNYRIPITFEKDKQTIFNLNGIQIINSNLQRRHIKNYDENYHNEAFKFLKYFNNDKKKTIIDLGANEGEISIFFAKKINCKVFAVECAQKNLDFLYANIKLNDVKNVDVFRYAISDKNNLSLSVDFKSNQTQVIEKDLKNLESQNELVNSITLTTFIKNQNLEFIDFIKIDIENSNHLVADCILKNAKIIKSLFWEVGFCHPEKFKNIILSLCDAYDFYLFAENDLIKISTNDLLIKIDKEVVIDDAGFDIFLYSKKFNKDNVVII